MTGAARQDTLKAVHLGPKFRTAFQYVEASLGSSLQALDVTAAFVREEASAVEVYLCSAAGLWTIHLLPTVTYGDPSKGTTSLTTYANTITVTPWRDVVQLKCKMKREAVRDTAYSTVHVSLYLRGIEEKTIRRIDMHGEGEQAEPGRDPMGFFAAVARRMGNS